MRDRTYYSVRTGKNPLASGLDLTATLELFKTEFGYLMSEDYFQEYFGFQCTDGYGRTPGLLGDINGAILLRLRKYNLWPVSEKYQSYSEDDLFDMLEFLHDHISKPVDGTYHQYNDCGMHYTTFNRSEGQSEFRARMNQVLRPYKGGFEINEGGEILELPEHGIEELFRADLPRLDPENVEARVDAAMTKFRRHRASLDDRRDAIRELVAVLEFLRPRIKEVLTSPDESDLFNIANNFGIRHHNSQQKTRYDRAVWYSWMFYYYLATIHACTRLIDQNRKGPGTK